MRAIFVVSHPGHVHFFKNAVKQMEEEGGQACVCAVDKEMTLYLLEKYGIGYELMGGHATGAGKAVSLLAHEKKFFSITRRFRPNAIFARAQPYAFHIGRLTDTPSYFFTDTEHARINYHLSMPFASKIVTPACFLKNLGLKHVRVDSLFELAYLQPKYFKPDNSVLDDAGLEDGDTYSVVRFVSWDATHDIRQGGFSLKDKEEIVEKLGEHGKVLISSEAALPAKLEKHRLKIPVEKIHDLLHYASLYVGEGATMATEAGLLGTPSILINSLVGTMGNFIELEKAGLVYGYREPAEAKRKSLEILQDQNSKKRAMEKAGDYVCEKQDINEWMLNQLHKHK